MAEAVSIGVQVCHAASPHEIFLREIELPPGSTVLYAIQRSGLLEQMRDLDLTGCRVGLWNKLKTFETVVNDRDRIEIYRPLIADPMDARRRRAAKTAK